MNIHINIILFCFGLFYVQSNCEGPILPNTYSQDFHRIMYGPKQIYNDNDGKVWYDYTNQRARYDYIEPQHERLCQDQDLSPDNPEDTCHIIFAESGAMYAHYPNQESCCRYCEPGLFCTVLRPDWMINATFVGTEVVEESECNVYSIAGFQTNYWAQTEDGVPCRYWISLPNDDFPIVHDNKTYNQGSFSLDPIPDSVFEIPEYCDRPCPNPACPPVCPDKKIVLF